MITYSSLGSVKGKKGKVSSALSACTGIGSTFGPMFGGFIGEVFSYSTIFLGYIPILFIVGIYIYINMDKRITDNK